MLRPRYSFLAVLFGLLPLAAAASQTLTDRRIDSLVAAMTLEEKLGQLNLLSAGGRASPEQTALVRRGLVGGLFNVIGTENTQAVDHVATTESRLKIPLLFGLDVIHGFRTIFPIPLAEAGAFDPELAEATARAAGREAAAAGINWTYAPMVDIARDPRWGRIAEGSGEDTYLGSQLAAARVRGFQESILATAKHFAAYGAAEAGRDYSSADISPRTLREVYLPPFKAAVDAGVATLMSAFNDIGGVPASGNAWLTDTLLRREWGFRGMVVSDWTSVAELIPHGIAGSRDEAGRRALTAGVDMDMQSSIYVETLAPLVQSGRIPMAVVDEAVRRVLRAKARVAQLKPAAPNAVEFRTLARRAARESIVLLKNDRNLLPLDRATPVIAVIGPLADNQLDPLGPWHTDGKPEDVVTVLQGIKSRVPAGTQVLYAQGAGIEDPSTAGFAEAVDAARRAKVAILVLGERHDMSGEAASRAYLGLPGVQQQLLEAVAATGTPVVLVLMNGRPLILEWAAEHVPAILETWYLGVEAGNATAEVLFGEVNPSGRLPVTFPRAVGQIPIYYNHRNTGRPPAADKFTSKYIDVPVTPRYPFGYGLSYTRFEYRDLKVLFRTTIGSRDLQAGLPRGGPSDTLSVLVTVANTGARDGTEVVQLYVRDEVGSVARPVRELKGFLRVTLKPGESRRVELRLAARDLAFYGLDMRSAVEAGTFRVFVGPNSIEGLEATFEVAYP
ncbi:MAG TPA: glycoside hydrolase family 3 N-terminal domain-containing protein [Gemmatimonadales bacterium]|jgi:beta-glucosidase|nr:glycoside hydrolase family 3 N-terminal domain-containing protein [Gemmatimonadales bacterium]